MSNLHLEIISPTGILFKGECHLVVVPSVSGDVGLMYGHESIVALLREGQVSIYDEKQNLVETFEVKSGFVEMQSQEKMTVLLDS